MKLSVKIFGFAILILSALASSFYFFQLKKTEIYIASSIEATGHTLALAPYCMAIRGNGELEPAHWGAMAKTIEQLGLPSAMAGGSSASISMFWLNAVAQNPFIQQNALTLEEKNLRAALLVKSFLGFFTELKQTKFSQDFFRLYGIYNQVKAESMTQEMLVALAKKNFVIVKRVLNEGFKLGLFDQKSLQPLFDSLQNKQNERTQFYLEELSESVRQFGKFDATTDANLFFRAGLVNFENASVSFGRLAAFYSAVSISEEISKTWSVFFQNCTTDSKELTWTGLLKKNPTCGVLFHQLFESYFKKEPELHLENSFIGEPIEVYPATSVLVGQAAQEADQAMNDYHLKMDHQFGLHFKPTNSEEVRFGYWGNPVKLDLISKSLDQTDEKSRRFLALGSTTWKQVLSMSPSEPGLSPFKKFSANNEVFISAGGWSDLHPVEILKSSGCENVVYLTRQGGESFFAQGVANRLMDLKRDISKLQTATPEQKKTNLQLNNLGDPTADQNSVWSKLFNMANPKSSINRALTQADAVLCTNWNAYNVKNDFVALIENSYQSSFAISSNPSQLISKLAPVLKDAVTGCQPLQH